MSIRLCSVVLTSQNDSNRTAAFIQNFQEQSGLASLGPLHTFEGKSKPNVNVQEKEQLIYKSHWDMTQLYTPYCESTESYLLLMENDCRFKTSIQQKVVNQIQYLNKNYPDWTILLLGHFAAGILWFVQTGLVMSTYPLESHAYILNYRILSKMLSIIPRTRWRKPYAVEKWKSFPKYTIFALFPTDLVYQCELPTSWKLYKFSYKSYRNITKVSEQFFVWLLPIVTFGFSLFFPRVKSYSE